MNTLINYLIFIETILIFNYFNIIELEYDIQTKIKLFQIIFIELYFIKFVMMYWNRYKKTKQIK